MRQTIASALTRFRQGGDIAPVRRHPPASLTIHRRVIGIGDDDRMTTRLEVWRDPFTFGRGFEPNAHPRSAPARRGESITRRVSFMRLKSASQQLWSASYHLTEGASRFILSVGNRVLGGFPSAVWLRSVRPQARQRPGACAFSRRAGEALAIDDGELIAGATPEVRFLAARNA